MTNGRPLVRSFLAVALVSIAVRAEEEDPEPGSDVGAALLAQCQQERGPIADTALPPIDTAPCTGADADQLRSLIAQLRNLKERSDVTRVQYEVAQCVRNKAASQMEGLRGTWAKYFNALLGMATNAEAPEAGKDAKLLAKAARVAFKAADWASTTLSVVQDPHSLEAWVEAGLDVAGNEDVLAAAARQTVITNAQQAAYRLDLDVDSAGDATSQWLSQMGDKEAEDFLNNVKLDPAGDLTFGDLNKASTVVGLATSTAGYYEATGALEGDLFAYFEYRADAARLKTQLDDIDKQIEQLNRQIADVRSKCKLTPEEKNCVHQQAEGTIGFCRHCCKPEGSR